MLYPLLKNGENAMQIGRAFCATLVCASMMFDAAASFAQSPNAPVSGPRVQAGGELVGSKCFQCHTDSMFRDQRQDRRAWTATIYRMVGRGAQWTPDEIDAMADYLGVALGPDAKPFWATSK
jgi:hypothetical protein